MSSMLRRLPAVSTFSSLSSSNAAPVLWRAAAGGNESDGGARDDLITVQVLSWGRGSSGQLGGGKEEIRFYPSPVASLLLPRNFRLGPVSGRFSSAGNPPMKVGNNGGNETVEVGISCGLFHSGLLVDGKLWMWGKGDGGRLGFGDEVSVFKPSLNPNLDDIRSIALGGLHSTALTRAGDIFTCLQGLWGIWGSWALCLHKGAIAKACQRSMAPYYFPDIY